jgi:hypothetical protein
VLVVVHTAVAAVLVVFLHRLPLDFLAVLLIQ